MIDRELLRELPPIVAGTFIAMVPMMTAPFLIGGGTVAAGLSPEQAGWIATASVGGVALASMGVSPFIAQLPFRRAMMAFGGVLAASYVALFLAESKEAFLMLALISGLSGGILLAGMAVRVAELPDPDRAYGYIYSGTSIVFALLLLALPAIGEAAGPRSMFLLIGACAGVAVPGMLRLKLCGHDGGQAATAP